MPGRKFRTTTVQKKLRRPFSLVVKGDLGFSQGEIWWLDGDEVEFFCVEKLLVNTFYEARVDVVSSTRMVDIFLFIKENPRNIGSGAGAGYLHKASFKLAHKQDFWILRQQLLHFNPELRDVLGGSQALPPGSGEPSGSVPTLQQALGSLPFSVSRAGFHDSSSGVPVRFRSRPETRSGQAPGTLSARSQAGSRRLSSTDNQGKLVGGERRNRIRTSRQGSHRKVSGVGSSRSPVSAATPGKVATTSQPRGNWVLATVDRGDPATVLIRFETAKALRTGVRLRGNRVRIAMATTEFLSVGQNVLLAMQLPDQTYVQFGVRVSRIRKNYLVLAQDNLSTTVACLLGGALEKARNS